MYSYVRAYTYILTRKQPLFILLSKGTRVTWFEGCLETQSHIATCRNAVLTYYVYTK